MNHSVKFWDRIAERYSQQPIADEAAYQKKLEITREYLKPDMSVLEFGCGTGSTAIIHAPYVKQIRAIDVSSEMIKIARSKAEAENIDNITFEQLSIEELTVGDKPSLKDTPSDNGMASLRTFDVVLGLSILHLLENKEEIIALVYRMLKPGGIFVTSTMCLGDNMKWFKIVAPIGKFFGLMPLVKVFTVQELSDSLTDANFAIDYQWQPSKDKAVFIVAKKAE